jgi:transcriptional regulator with XRE-family HTH domain
MKDSRIKPRTIILSGRQLLQRWIVRGRMTQGEAAEQIGISRVKLNQYLNAEARPSLETAIRIEDRTGIGMRCWLLDDEFAPSPDGNSAEARARGESEPSVP